MNAVETIGIHIIWKAGRATDTRYNNISFLAVSQNFRHIRKCSLKSGKNTMVTAAGAPSYFLVAFEFLECISWHCFVFLEVILNCSNYFLNKERLALYFVVLTVTELRETSAQIVYEMSAVEFTYKDVLKTAENLLSILWKRENIVKIRQFTSS